jgi:hypothetical protein
MSSQGRVKLQVWLLIALVFALGAVTGGSLDRLYLSRSGALRSGIPNHLRGPNRMVELHSAQATWNRAPALASVFVKRCRRTSRYASTKSTPGATSK